MKTLFFDPIGDFQGFIRETLQELATNVATSAFEFLGEYVIAFTDLSRVPMLTTFILWAQWASGTIVMIAMIKGILENLKGEMLLEGDSNFLSVVGNAAVAMSLIYATPHIIKVFLLPINNAVVKSITGLGIDVESGNEYIDKVPGLTGQVVALHLILMALVWAVCILIFSIAGAIRYVDLAILLIFGPLAAASFSNRGEVFKSYWTEVLAVVFTQSVHVLLAYWIIQWTSKASLMGIVFAIGGTIVAFKGPQVLRQFLYTSGAGGGMAAAGRMVFYRMMLRNVGR